VTRGERILNPVPQMVRFSRLAAATSSIGEAAGERSQEGVSQVKVPETRGSGKRPLNPYLSTLLG
jgi:hypothetical protein